MINLKIGLFALILGFSTLLRAELAAGPATVLPEHARIFIKVLLYSVKKPQAAKLEIFQTYLDHLNARKMLPVKIVSIKTLEEYIEFQRKQLPNYLDLEDEWDYLQTAPVEPIFQYKFANSRVKNKVEAYQKRQIALLEKITGKNLPIEGAVFASIEAYLLNLADKIDLESPSGTAYALTLSKASDALYEHFNRQFETVGSKALQSTNSTFNDSRGAVFSILIEEYFKHIPIEMRKNIINALVESPEATEPLEILSLSLTQTGPIMQKFIQFMASDNKIDQKLAKVLEKIENGSKPIPWFRVEEMLAKEKLPFKILRINEQPLGVGSIAQNHAARVEWSTKRQQDLAIRLVKPRTEKYLEIERTAFQAMSPKLDAAILSTADSKVKLSSILEDIITNIKEDYDLSTLATRQQKGVTTYGKKVVVKDKRVSTPLTVQFKVPNVVKMPKHSNIFAQELIPKAKKLRELLVDQPAIGQIAVEQLAELWLENALFGDGFFHADLHQGNFIIDYDASANAAKVTLFDFGMSNTLTLEERKAFMVFNLAALTKDPALIGETLWELAEDRGRFRSKEAITVDFLLDRNGLGLITRDFVNREKILAWAVEQGIKLPKGFVGFVRGLGFVEQMLISTQSEKTTASVLSGLLKKNWSRALSFVEAHRSPILKNLVALGIGKTLNQKQDKVRELNYKNLKNVGVQPLPAFNKVPNANSCQDVFPKS